GIRKVAGADKKKLNGKSIGESLLMAVSSGFLSLIMVYFSLPSFILFIIRQLAIPANSAFFWLAGISFIIITGVIAGSYPAFFLSSFKPVSVLKGTFRRSHALINPRKVLVVLQFTFAITLIICTFIVVQQI